MPGRPLNLRANWRESDDNCAKVAPDVDFSLPTQASDDLTADRFVSMDARSRRG